MRELSNQPNEVAPQDLWRDLHSADFAKAEAAALTLKHKAEADPTTLNPQAAKLLREAMRTPHLRVRWNLIVILGLLQLTAKQRLAITDWLFERLEDASPFTRTFALQSLCNQASADPALLARLKPVAQSFAENGTAAMRARARKLLTQGDRHPHPPSRKRK